MKKSLLLFLISFFLLGTLHGQSPVVQQILNDVNPDSLIFFVEELSGEVTTLINGTPVTILSRNKYQPGNEQAKDYIVQKLESYGLTADVQSFSSTGKNVIGIQPGTEFPNQQYMICAHYDDMPSGTVAPGADDNASGTAAVLEAARILSQYSFPFTILYALWDEEEQGLIGSEYYANQAAANGDSILGVFNLDMVAWDSDNDYIVNIHTDNVANTFQLYDKMVEVNDQYNLGLTIVEVYPAAPYSDHESFLNAGYSAILLIEDDNDFNNYYHTTNDLVQYFNQPYYLKSAQLAIGALATFAFNLNMEIIHTPIASMEVSQEIQTSAFISTGLNIGTGTGAPRLYYRVDTGGGFSDFYEVTGTPAIESATYNFVIPAQPLGSKVQYYLAAQDEDATIVTTLPKGGGGFNPPGNIPPDDLFQFFVGPFTVALSDSAMNLDNWTVTGGWGLTSTKFTSAPYSFTDSPSGNYGNNANARMTYNGVFDLSDALGAYIEFETQWDIEDNWDYAQLQVSTNSGATWIALEGNYTNPGTGSFQPNGEPLYDGTQLSWVHELMDISEFSGQQITLRFLLMSDGLINEDGWYVDDITLTVFYPIPVELVSFNAVSLANSVKLNWTTATELNNSGFEIERKSVDDQNWSNIAFIPGKGTTTEVTQYSFTDNSPLTGTSFYRLKQLDFDGTYEYFGPVEVQGNFITDYVLEQNYPNPFNPVTKLTYKLPMDGFTELKIYDILGNEIATLVEEQQKAGIYTVNFDASDLSSGTYIYKLQSGNFVQVRKMVLLK